MHSSKRASDVIGVGFGPSNLALAIAMDEAAAAGGHVLSSCFIERQPRFIWHGGMLLPDSDMQISFLKDLALMRNPTSPFTFINYLHSKRRLEAFINLKNFFPSRIEFNDYLSWAAEKFAGKVLYGEDVIDIEPHKGRGVVTHLAVTSRNEAGRTQTALAGNMVLAIGGYPKVPPLFQNLTENNSAFHSSHYLARIDEANIVDGALTRIAVIGRGQSAAEIALDLYGRYSNVSIDLITRGVALRPADGSPFVNEIFNPDYTDVIFNQTADVRENILAEFRNTNYAVVDADLIETLYQIVYSQRVTGNNRLSVLAMHDIKRAAISFDKIEFEMVDGISGAYKRQNYDLAILATGYDRDNGARLLSSVSDYIPDLTVTRNYRVQTTPEFLPGIYMQGYSEKTHGLSDTLLSVLALRSQEIAAELMARAKDRQTAA